jgi:hypothetical protein
MSEPSNIFPVWRQNGKITVTLLDFGIAGIKTEPVDLPLPL